MPLFMSIDCETTGLIGGYHSIIEIAAILTDDKKSFTRQFHQKIIPEGMIWSAFCLKLHARYIEKFHEWEKKKKNKEICDPDEYVTTEKCSARFIEWIKEYQQNQKIIPCGKNYTGFDLTFIKGEDALHLVTPANYEEFFDHRAVDIGMAFWNGTEEYIPSLSKCKKRAKQSETVAHTALEDAQDCLDLLFYWNENNKNKW